MAMVMPRHYNYFISNNIKNVTTLILGVVMKIFDFISYVLFPDDEGFKFVTFEDLEKLHLSHLIGTNLLRAEMHGFLIREGLYKNAAAKAAQAEKEKAALSEAKNTKVCFLQLLCCILLSIFKGMSLLKHFVDLVVFYFI